MAVTNIGRVRRAVGVAEGPTGLFAGYLDHAVGLEEVHEHGVEVGMMSISIAAVLIGIGLAWLMYVRSPALPAKVASAFGPLYQASLNKFYFDEIFWAILVAPLRGLAWFRQLVRSQRYRFDCRWLGDGAAHVQLVSMMFQSGRMPSYALMMWFGLLVCVLFAMRILPLIKLR